MTPFFFKLKIPTDEINEAQPGVRRSLQYLFNDGFVQAPQASRTAMEREPFSNDTPPPSGQTMHEPPEDCVPKRPTLHLPSASRVESSASAR